MVATDTIVGIVGAVLLVAVMAGVFVYEYNNPVAPPDSEEGRQQAFMRDYPALSPQDDIDGDGVPNYMDDDIDGDGTPNEADRDVSTHREMSGALGPQVGTVVVPSLTMPFYVGNGSVHIVGTVTASAQAPNPLFSGNWVVELLRPDGTVADNQASAPGGGGTFTVETSEGDEIPAGTWSIRVTQNQAGAGGSVHIAADVHYPAPPTPEHGYVPEQE